MDQGLIPRRYAKALYEVGAAQGSADQLYGVMQQLSSAFAAEPALQATLANPFVADADKERLIKAAAGSGANTALFEDFLALLRKNGRLDIARDTANAYIDLYRSKNRIFKVVIESAAELSEPVRQRMVDLIKSHIGGGKLECSFEVNPKLVGGFRVRLGNELLDASVASQLNRIRLGLIK